MDSLTDRNNYKSQVVSKRILVIYHILELPHNSDGKVQQRAWLCCVQEIQLDLVLLTDKSFCTAAVQLSTINFCIYVCNCCLLLSGTITFFQMRYSNKIFKIARIVNKHSNYKFWGRLNAELVFNWWLKIPWNCLKQAIKISTLSCTCTMKTTFWILIE
jgi:hypothetical protein